MKILITGYSGYLGKFLTAKLKNLGYDIYGVNSKNYDTFDVEYKDVKFRYIFHLAVKTSAGGYCQTHMGEQFLINQTINTKIMNYWYENNKDAKFITFGSSCGYDDNVIKEEKNYMIGVPETGYMVYGMIKRMLLTGIAALNNEFNMNYLYFIPSTIYGYNYDIDDKHFIFDLIRKICDAKYNNIEPVTLWGNGEQRRELIYVDDCIDIIINSMNKNNEVINLSTGLDYSIKDYAKQICEIVDYDFQKILFDETKFVGAKSKKIENTKNKKFVFTNIKEGLLKTIEYYKETKGYGK